VICGKSVAALVPARAGSKGLPGKNILPIAGRPLVAWTIHAALENSQIDRVIVSSDDPAVLTIASDLGATPLCRPDVLATDSTLMSEVIQHAITVTESCDILVLLQPTSPLRTSKHIEEALEILIASSTDAVASVYRAPVPPELMYREDTSRRLVPIVSNPELRRQDLPTTYVLNGAIYAAFERTLGLANFRYEALSMTPYIMSREDSIDIDEWQDFEIARILLQSLGST